MVGVADPRHRSESGECNGDDGDSPKSDDRIVFKLAIAIDKNNFVDQPSDTGACATGMNTTQVLRLY